MQTTWANANKNCGVWTIWVQLKLTLVIELMDAYRFCCSHNTEFSQIQTIYLTLQWLASKQFKQTFSQVSCITLDQNPSIFNQNKRSLNIPADFVKNSTSITLLPTSLNIQARITFSLHISFVKVLIV